MPEAEEIFDGTEASVRQVEARRRGGAIRGAAATARCGPWAAWACSGTPSAPYGDFSMQFEFRDARTDDGWSNGGAFVRFPNPDDDRGAAGGRSRSRRRAPGTRRSRPGWRSTAATRSRPTTTRAAASRRRPARSTTSSRATSQQARPVAKGDWTKYEIRVVGQQYTIIRNGKVINEFDNSIGKESSRAR